MPIKKTKITSLAGTVGNAPSASLASVKRGDTVSLNFKRRCYFEVGSFILASDNPTEVIPEDITAQELEVINRAVNNGHIVLSKTPLPRQDKDINLLEKYINILDNARDVQKNFHPAVVEIAKMGGTFGGYNKHELLDLLLQHEINNKCRNVFIEYLHYAMEKIPGHSKVTDTYAPKKVSPSGYKPIKSTVSEAALKEL